MSSYFSELQIVMQEPFMLRAFAAGIMVALLTSMVGTFVTLRKESFIADAVAHASLAGIAIGLVATGMPLLMALMVAIFMGIAITYIRHEGGFATDAAIGILFPVLFAFGIFLISSQSGYRPELNSYLFGSLLAITLEEVFWAVATLVLVVFAFAYYYKPLLYSTFDPEAAKVAGVRVRQIDYIFSILTAISVVIAVKIAGIVLVTALFVIPATSAKLLARNFSQMLPIAIIHNLLAVSLGLLLSLNHPPGPVIVLVSAGIFLLTLLVRLSD
ncbi:MAG: metal ABC transporter permease [Candidatus Dojkabacteria bacterium]